MGISEDQSSRGEEYNPAQDLTETAGRGVRLSGKTRSSRRKYSGRLKKHPGKKTDKSAEAGKARKAKEAKKAAEKRFEKQKAKEEAKKTAEGTKELSKVVTEAVKAAARAVAGAVEKAGEAIAANPVGALVIAAICALLLIIAGSLGSCSGSVPGGITTVVATSYTAEDEDILAVNDDYTVLESDLSKRITNISSTNPGYDEYRFDLEEIGHDPWILTTELTMKLNAYTREDAQAEIKRLFNIQYELTLTPVNETRTREVTKTGKRTVTGEDGLPYEETYTYTDQEEYIWHVLVVKLRNNGLEKAVENSGFTEDEMERYEVMLSLHGNKPYLFDSDIYTNPDADGEGTPGNPITDYEIAGDALTDEQFANMWAEAKKYLGMSYVWGGSTPSTGFDCSGFVCWVINHSGAGSIGRTTAEGIRQWTDTIPASDRKPGDIVFFEGTYDTAGASHVGIYIGDGKMIHCGDPIKVSNIDSGYFARHFMCYGRIPG